MDNKKLILLDRKQTYNPVHLILWANKYMFYGSEEDAFSAYKLEISNMCNRKCIDKHEFINYLKNIKFNENMPIALDILLSSMINKKEDAVIINNQKYYSVQHACKEFKLNYDKEMKNYEILKAGGIKLEDYLLSRYRDELNKKLRESARQYLTVLDRCENIDYVDGLYETYNVQCSKCGFIGTMSTLEISVHKCRKH